VFDDHPFLVRSSAPSTKVAGSRSRKSDRVEIIAAGNRRCLVATASGVEHWGIKFGQAWDDNDQWGPKMYARYFCTHLHRARQSSSAFVCFPVCVSGCFPLMCS
jgi:hypothetical protein